MLCVERKLCQGQDHLLHDHLGEAPMVEECSACLRGAESLSPYGAETSVKRAGEGSATVKWAILWPPDDFPKHAE